MPSLRALGAALALAAAAVLPRPALARNDGLALTPPMTTNSWTSFGSGVSAADLLKTGTLLVQTGLRDAGFSIVGSDDGWSLGTRDAQGRLQADPSKFPDGIPGVVASLKALNLSFGIYGAESSVTCTGRSGTLFNEFVDAQTFVDWGVYLVKNDNCGEYSYGNSRYWAWSDAVTATGVPMLVSTEPFSLVPTPAHATFAHFWRTGNDIGPDWGTILDRIDRNDKWAEYAGPGHWNDPDMLQCGNGPITDAECRSHFALWAMAKAPLVIGADISRFSNTTVATMSNRNIIAVSQDPLGVQARKLAVNGTLVPRFVGLGECTVAQQGPSPSGLPGENGVSPKTLLWHTVPLGTVQGAQAYALVHNATNRCLGLRSYVGRLTPLLVPCASPSEDLTQAWAFPTGPNRIGGLMSLSAVAAAAAGQNPTNATVLSVANSTAYGAIHGQDTIPLLDYAYGTTVLELAPYNPEPPCDNRNCQDYDPLQSWYFSPGQGTVSLAAAPGNFYRVFSGPGYDLTSHLPLLYQFCLTSVASISNDGVDPATTTTGGVDVWGGPLSGGAFVFGALNRNAVGTSPAPIDVQWSMLENPAMTNATAACVRELYTDTPLGVVTGGITVNVAPHDIAVLRVVPGASSC